MMQGANRPAPFHSRIGTQTFSPLYTFTAENALVETARGIWEMGSDVLKMNLSPSAYGGAAELDRLPYAELAAREEYRTVFRMPFRHYILWVHDKGAGALNLQMDEAAEQAAYRDMYGLARYLLTTYDRTGKVFLLGHWEGDWVLLGGYDTSREPDDGKIRGMIRSLRVRQKAVEDARRDTPHSDVYVGHYCEVNRPLDAKDRGMKRMTTHVLPHVTVDMVSYSSYDSLLPHRLTEALDFIEQNARFTPYFDGLFGKKVFVGEYDGYHDYIKNGAQTPQQQADNAWAVIEDAVSWGVPFVLYWEFYSNGAPGMPPEEGFWLIDRENRRQPVYYLHRDLLAKLNLYRRLCLLWRGREPYEEEVNRVIRGLRDKTEAELAREFFSAVPEGERDRCVQRLLHSRQGGDAGGD
ncbi:MAG TPA: hypothetical protein H9674_04655 [Firmicutes bacterium]|nr:hypothetical protein [Bacillota bacterium]